MKEEKIEKKILNLQKNEITEHFIYLKLSERIKDRHNKEILIKLSKEEKEHYRRLRDISKKDVKPNTFKIWFYFIIIKILGFTFGLKLMERGEKFAQKKYEEVLKNFPEIKEIVSDEKEHEEELLGILDEERLKYIGSMVLGLSDALVELTGTLAGLTFSLRNNSLVALSVLVTGISASLSMAGSEYLSTKTEGEGKNPIKASIITGFTYILSVFFLILPYFLFKNYIISFIFTLILALCLVIFFTFYVSIAQDKEFKKRFFEMSFIILSVSLITFIIGLLIKRILGIEI
ncbi:MAG: VIT1/CCC1 transporter family protein [Dictyoglomus sp.]|nr:VIT1/CCC1 transporter family protein [Dictyoglomus sp.]MCX7942251.1 VIT1/CCC1 transporter family protein [Dictyoglomaceae bacterium]MDW8188338.1 VIT1/CCC1 transporter family protein [Dictyoglomus sp.]